MNKIENYFYESRPYLYLAIAAFALFRSHDGNLGALERNCGFILLAMSLIVLRARFKYRTIVAQLPH